MIPTGLPGKLPGYLDDPGWRFRTFDHPRAISCLEPPAGEGIEVILLSRG
jgi:hypothetical protein